MVSNGRSSLKNKKNGKKNRLGYTSGTCAAGAAKAAAICLMTGDSPEAVSLLLPSGKRFWFPVKAYEKGKDEVRVRVSTIAGNYGAPEISVRMKVEGDRFALGGNLSFSIKGGKGVGKVAKPGLPVAVGEDAIYPDSQALIKENILELSRVMHFGSICQISIIIEVPDGERLARQALFHRIGIEGGIAIRETPALSRLSTPEAWQQYISQSLQVARATENRKIILAPGAASERFAKILFPDLPDEAFILTADHIDDALTQCKLQGIEEVVYVSFFSKMLKAMTGKLKMKPRDFVTSLVPVFHIGLLEKVSEELLEALNQAKMPKEGLAILIAQKANILFLRICQRAHRNLARLVGKEYPLEVVFLSYEGKVLSKFKNEERYGMSSILNYATGRETTVFEESF